jgi:bifunctional DNA-binding transcriptional regulator/antitoxin component of YhaV-PrlF toxin-antitoxin module
MKELFRLKIGSKRQMTAPQRLLSNLNLGEGDEIQFTVEDGQIVSAQPYKSVSTALLPDVLMAKIKAREKLLTEGKGVDLEDELEKMSSRV